MISYSSALVLKAPLKLIASSDSCFCKGFPEETQHSLERMRGRSLSKVNVLLDHTTANFVRSGSAINHLNHTPYSLTMGLSTTLLDRNSLLVGAWLNRTRYLQNGQRNPKMSPKYGYEQANTH